MENKKEILSNIILRCFYNEFGEINNDTITEIVYEENKATFKLKEGKEFTLTIN